MCVNLTQIRNQSKDIIKVLLISEFVYEFVFLKFPKAKFTKDNLV